MRHGRKSKNKLFNGYKRHLMKLLDAEITVAVEVLPANQAEQDAMGPLVNEAERHGPLEALLLDRGYLASPRVSELAAQGVTIRCQPWRCRNGERFTKDQFDIRLAEGRVVCPAGASAAISGALLARFPNRTCATCELRRQCKGARKNALDARRCAAVDNVQTLARLREAA